MFVIDVPKSYTDIIENIDESIDVTYSTLSRDILFEYYKNKDAHNLGKILFRNDGYRTIFHPILIERLIGYCIIGNDIEFINYIISVYEKEKRPIPIKKAIIFAIVEYGNYETKNIFFGSDIKAINKDDLIYYSILYDDTNVLDMLRDDYGFNLENFYNDKDGADFILFGSSSKMIGYFQSMGYDPQFVFDYSNYQYSFINFSKIISLTEIGIDLSRKINKLMIECANTPDHIKFCIEYGATNITEKLNERCLEFDYKSIEYLLSIGENISNIDELGINCVYPKNIVYKNIYKNKIIYTMKLLMDNGYTFTSDRLNELFVEHIKFDKNINNIIYLLNMVTNFDYLFSTEKNRKFQFDKQGCLIYYIDEKNVVCNVLNSTSSILEDIVARNKIELFNLIVEYNFDDLKPELDRLFIVAVSNGKLEIMNLILELGANIYCYDNLAMICAIYFGHYDVLLELENKGLDLDNNFENLFMIVAYGTSDDSAFYNRLLIHNVFTNNLFYYGTGYENILDYLIDNNIDKSYDDDFFRLLDTKYYKLKLIEYCVSYDNKFLLENKPHTFVMEKAISTEKIDIITFLLDNGVRVNIDTTKCRKEIIKLLEEYNV